MLPRLAAVILTGVLVAGCTVGPNYQRPTLTPPPAHRGLTPDEAQALVDLAWFEQFNETSLTALVRDSLDGNLDLDAGDRAGGRVPRPRGLRPCQPVSRCPLPASRRFRRRPENARWTTPIRRD